MDIFRGAAASACFLGIIFSALSGIMPDEKFSKHINMVFSLVMILAVITPFIGADISFDDFVPDEGISSDYGEIYAKGLSETVQSELCGNIGALLEENGITAVKISADVNNFSDGSISISKVTVNLSDGAEKDKTYKLWGRIPWSKSKMRGALKMRADIRELVRKLLSSKKAMTAAAALGIMGMLMILFSGGDKNENTVQTQDVPESASWSDYSTQTEERLETILSAIDGVGRVKVMVTVSSTEEYVYAEAEKLGADREERDYVTVKGSGGEEALVRKINVPVITGVVAVCDGGNSDKVREDVYRAVTAALGIPSNSVYVTAME